MPGKATRFRKEWLEDVEFSQWLQEVPKDPQHAYCSLCRYSFNLSNMGVRALKSHVAGQKHRTAASLSRSTVPISSTFVRLPSAPMSEASTVSTVAVSSTAQSSTTEGIAIPLPSTAASVPAVVRGTMKTYLLNDKVTEAEIRWCLQNVMNHRSLRSSEKDVELFPLLFSDSEIAAKMKMHRDKMAYIIAFALKAYFQDQLLDVLQNCSHFVVGFDESLNKVSQTQQMDLTIRYWDSGKNEVCAQYLSSAFLKKTTAMDLLAAFTKAVSSLGLPLTKILQVSMDGPNVNFKFFRELQKDVHHDENDAQILNMGSCGIHTMHCAFKAGINATGWKIIQFLRASYNLFKNLPARRGIYTRLTSSTVFPMKFCAVRWLESNVVAQRALDILPYLRTFVNGVIKEKIAPTCDSSKIVQEALADKLLPVKLAFFCTVASDLEPFMREFQTDAPRVPFLHTAIAEILRNLMDRFVQSEVQEKCSSLDSLDLKDEKNLLPPQKIKIGHASQSQFRKCEKLSDLEILTFRKNCKTCLITAVMKLMERSPIKYRLTKAASCFDSSIAAESSIGINRLQNLLTILVDNNWISGQNADEAARQFSSCCALPEVKEQLRKFRRRDERLDNFWREIFDRANIPMIFKVMQMVMVLSHGNAQVERGFSINADCLLTNMREETLVARRVTYDAVSALGGLAKVEMTRSLLHAARNARSRFEESKERRQRESEEKQAKLKKKRQAESIVKELTSKKAKVLEEAQREMRLIDEKIEELKKQ